MHHDLNYTKKNLCHALAEAQGIRGTGIGCFFDDAVHSIYGFNDRKYQSLYHFTMGGPVEDKRLRTLRAYKAEE